MPSRLRLGIIIHNNMATIAKKEFEKLDLDLVMMENLMTQLYPGRNWQEDILSDIVCAHDLQEEYLERMYKMLLKRVV